MSWLDEDIKEWDEVRLRKSFGLLKSKYLHSENVIDSQRTHINELRQEVHRLAKAGSELKLLKLRMANREREIESIARESEAKAETGEA